MSGWGAAIAGVTSLAGEFLAAEKEAEAKRLEQQALGDIAGFGDGPYLRDVIAAEVADATEGMPNDFGNLGARNRAIQAIIDEGLSGGNSLESRLAMEEGRRASAAQELRDRQAVMQQARLRGLGSGGALAGQLQAQQAGADRQAMTGLQASAAARQRALASLAQGGAMAGQAESQDSDRALRLAESRNRIRQFNAGQRQQAGMFNAGLDQQRFDGRLAVAEQMARIRLGQAIGSSRDAQRTSARWQGIGNAAGQAIDAAQEDEDGANAADAISGWFGGM